MAAEPVSHPNRPGRQKLRRGVGATVGAMTRHSARTLPAGPRERTGLRTANGGGQNGYALGIVKVVAGAGVSLVKKV